MEIHIEPSAREYIMKKEPSQAVKLIVSERPGSCCRSAACYLFVQLGKVKPEQMHDYDKKDVEGIEVYYSKRVTRFYKSITLKIEQFLFLKNLVAM